MLRKIFIGLSVIIGLSLLLPTQGYSWWNNLSKIVSPERRAQLSSYPVEIIIQFNEDARPETFKAWLNRRDITDKFEKIENGMKALVGPEDGLRIWVKGKPRWGRKVNILWTKVKGPKRRRDIDVRVFFVKGDANAPPEILSTPITSASENQVYSYNFYATDPDGDILFYSLNLAPDGMVIDPYTGVITWTPAASQVGEHSVEAEVTDEKETLTQSFVVEVKENTLEASQFVPAASGGIVEVSDPLSEIFGARVIIPPDALPEDCIISITKVCHPSYAPPGCLAVDLQPSLTFNSPVTIEIPFTDEFINMYGISEENPPTLFLFNESSEIWEEVEDVTADLVDKKVVANVTHFSEHMAADKEGPSTSQKPDIVTLKECQNCIDGRNVLLIHGWRSSYGRYLGEDRKLFTADDDELLKFACTHYDNVYFYNYPTGDHIRTNAQRLAYRIPQHIPSECGFDIIAHSMGGLIARYLVEDGVTDPLCPLKNVDKVVMLGTPNKGVTGICLGLWAVDCEKRPGWCEVLPGSPFLYNLNKDADCNTQTATLYAVSGDLKGGDDGCVKVESAQAFVCQNRILATTDINHIILHSKMITNKNSIVAEAVEGWLNVEPIPPEIKDEAPTGTVTTNRPTISFTIESPICNQIDMDYYLLKLDEEWIDYAILEDGSVYSPKGTYEINPVGGGPEVQISFTPNYDLEAGEHGVEVSVTDAAASGLELQEYWSKKDWSFRIEVRPIITDISPTGTINNWRPTIQARIYSPFGVDIDLSSIVMTLDGSVVNHTSLPDSGPDIVVSYVLYNVLEEGPHIVTLNGSDINGLAAEEKTWSFETLYEGPQYFYGPVGKITDRRPLFWAKIYVPETWEGLYQTVQLHFNYLPWGDGAVGPIAEFTPGATIYLSWTPAEDLLPRGYRSRYFVSVLNTYPSENDFNWLAPIWSFWY